MSRFEHVVIISILVVAALCDVVLVTAVAQIVWERWGCA